MSNWSDGTLCYFDTETTGVDPQSARIVAAVVGVVEGGRSGVTHTWLADPGVEIPAQATAVHGITTEQAREYGEPAGLVAAQISEEICKQLREGAALVAYNACFDLTVLDRECRRHELLSPEALLGHPLRPVIDPLVLDRYEDRYRRGKRTLGDVCLHYRVPLARAHDVGADGAAAAHLARALAGAYPELAAMGLDELHELQIGARKEQAASLQEYFRSKGSSEVVETAWPLLPG